MSESLSVILHVAKKGEEEAEKRRQRDMDRKLEAARKQKEADDLAHKRLWGWKYEGQESNKNMNHAFAGVKAILIPHKSKKMAMIELHDVCETALANPSIRWMRVSRRILDTIRPFQTFYRLKRRCIHRMHLVMRELYNRRRSHHALHGRVLSADGRYLDSDDNFPYEYPHREEDALLPMEAAYARRVPVGPAKIMLLRMLRDKCEKARALLQRTNDGIDKCEYMLACSSIYHERLAGCLKCGLIMVKGEMYLESFDRVTNSSIIVRRDFEMEILEKEKVEFSRLYAIVRGQLSKVEEELRTKTVYDIQAWWATRLTIRRARRTQGQMAHSLFYRRIRRLARLKKDVDKFDPWTCSLSELELQYCDLLPELSEYRLYKTKKAFSLALRFAQYILDVSKKKHAAAVFRERHRERKRFERLASMEMQRQRELRVEQTFRHNMVEKMKAMLARTWMCARFECNKRVFLSEFRYDTHMKLHRLRDSDGMKSREELYRLKMARRRKEELFIERVNILRGCVVDVRGDNGESSRSPIKSIRLPPASRRYMTKLPPLERSRSSSISSIHDVVGVVTSDNGAQHEVTGSDLLDEYELKRLLSGETSGEYEEQEGSEEGAQLEEIFDQMIVNIGHSDMDPTSSHEEDGGDIEEGYVAHQKNADSGGKDDCSGRSDQGSKVVDEEGTVKPTGDIDITHEGDANSCGGASVTEDDMDSLAEHEREPTGPYAVRKRGVEPTTSAPPSVEEILHSDKKALLERRIKDRTLAPPWMSMPQLTMLSEPVQSKMKIVLEVVSKVDSVEISSPKFVLDKHVFRIGTLGSCDYSMKCHDKGGDIRKVRRVSRIHCLVYVPLLLQQYSRHEQMQPIQTDSSVRREIGNTAVQAMSTFSSEENMGKYDESETHKHVTIVDNHSAWGTYVVSVNGVRKVPTNIQKGIPLVPGDLICIGVVRNGPPTMSPIDANKALVVFRVRME